MKLRSLIAALALGSLASLAFAQAAAPEGADRPQTAADKSKSKGSMTKEQRKAAAVEAQKKGEMGNPDRPQTASDKSKNKGSMTKEQRKAQTRKQQKEKQMTPAGESAEPKK